MPAVDLETLMSACTGSTSDNKITCETLAAAADEPPPLPEDFPPGSFWLSKDAEFDWFDRNAFYERNESTKANPNPNLNQSGTNSNASSQRFSVTVKAKPSFIRLPKTQKTSYAETKNRKCNKPANVRLFPKRTGSTEKAPVQMAEPSSPKVSCMGRVRSKRKNRKREKPVQKKERTGGIYKQFMSMFRRDKNRRYEPEAEVVRSGSRKSRPVRTGNGFVMEIEPPGLGAMKRFASGRKSSSSAADVAD